MILTDELLIKINLQLFAAPEDEGRTEEATEKKKREARDKGKVAKTSELAAALILLFTFIILAVTAKSIFYSLMEYMKLVFTSISTFNFTADNFKVFLLNSSWVGIKIVGPLLITALVIAFLADVAQIGFKFSLDPIKPELSKISFTFEKLIQRVLFSRHVAVNLLKSVLKVIIIVVISLLIIKSDYPLILRTIQNGLLDNLKLVSWITFKIILWVSVIMAIFSLFDYMYQRWEHLQSLKMTVHEVKEERKQYEGDPLIKARQRERFRSLIMRNIMQEVPKADVVVTNPTHFAVALLYDNEYMNAPQVLAKGADLIAKRIKEIAQENGVYVMENRLLARVLYQEVDVGEEIPAHLFEAVAHILSIVYEMEKKEAV